MTLADHAEPESFHKLLRGASSLDETRQIVRHLLAGCGRCLKRTAMAQTADADPRAWKYDDIFDRMERWLDLELQVEPEAVAVPALVAAGRR
ncbi:MAG TPA: hypothetical protein VIH93_08395 [Thermoanaerobaculia bacterium]|jgi:hypothetical protein